MVRVTKEDFVFHFGGHTPRLTVQPEQAFSVFTEDCFSGKLTSPDGKPREVAPYPKVNPLTGPIAIEGVKAGDIVAVHLLSLEPARNWGVATISPDFGLLSGTRVTPNLQRPQDERVWIWTFDEDRKSLVTVTESGARLRAPYRPFHGTIGVAPAHGEVRLGVVPGDFGGNLDIPDIGAGTTLYLRANMDGGHLYIGDGHYAQGDGEIAGTAIEGAFDTTMAVGRITDEEHFDWPRLETDTHIGVIGCARPLEDAVRIATAGTIRWVAQLAGLSVMDAHQLVTQICGLRIGNLVNPSFSAFCSVPKDLIENKIPIMAGMHQRLRSQGGRGS
jgi:acetamidase/formamidase